MHHKRGTGDISTYGLISAGGNIITGGTITSTGNLTSSSGSITSSTGTITGKNGSLSEFSGNRRDRKTFGTNICWCIYRIGFRKYSRWT
ncbi:MAG: hypothetical protein ACKPKO_01000 [Candidatus Fonsibacter sp.]